jgi:hypothetical protein
MGCEDGFIPQGLEAAGAGGQPIQQRHFSLYRQRFHSLQVSEIPWATIRAKF